MAYVRRIEFESRMQAMHTIDLLGQAMGGGEAAKNGAAKPKRPAKEPKIAPEEMLQMMGFNPMG